MYRKVFESGIKGSRVKKILIPIISILCVLLSGCSPNDYVRNMMNRMAPDDDEALAHEYLAALRSHDIDTATRLLDQQFNNSGVETNLAVVSEILDKGDIVSLELVGCNVFSTRQKRRTTLTYQYEFTNAWILATLTIDTMDEQKQVFGINVNPIPKSLGELNAFSFAGKGLKHYGMLFGAVAIPAFMLFSLVVCVRTKMKKRKWLWIIFIILGIGSLTLNWTTGQLSINPLNLQLLGAGCYKPGLYAQWTISIAFPLGALLFLLRRKKLINEPEEKDSQEPLPAVKKSINPGNEQGG